MSTNMSGDLDRIRAAAQQLHGVISDAATKHGGAAKADVEAVGQKAKSVAESVKASMGAQKEVAQKHLKGAVADLEAVQKHASEALKSSGGDFQASIRQALADARASVQKVSEAVSELRSTAAKTRK